MTEIRTSTTRHEGWTPERQLRFLHALTLTGSVKKAADAVGLSRESAHRLRKRLGDSLFALMWDRALEARARGSEGHTAPLPDGRLARLLGNHFRRESGNFVVRRPAGADREEPHRM